MLGSRVILNALSGDLTVAQVSRDPTDVFNDLLTAFLVLGTIVGVVVVAYILHSAYKYKIDGTPAEGEYDIDASAFSDDDEDESVARPQLGEIPSGVGKGGGKKLFLSFAISALIVVSLIIFAYWNLLYIEDTPEDAIEIGVDANQYDYEYTYPSGETTSQLFIPADKPVELNVTACHPGECGTPGEGDGEVWHTWHSQDLSAGADAIPGQYTQTWVQESDPGEYRVQCQELCGAGHSSMNFDDGVVVMEQAEFQDWCEDEECMDDEDLDEWLNSPAEGDN